MKISFKDCLTCVKKVSLPWTFLENLDTDIYFQTKLDTNLLLPMHACTTEAQANQYVYYKKTRKYSWAYTDPISTYVYIGIHSCAAGPYRRCIGEKEHIDSAVQGDTMIGSWKKGPDFLRHA